MPMNAFHRKLLLGAALTFALAACQSIAGIEDRVLDPNAPGDSSPACKTYCATVMSNCTGKNAVYSTEEMCLGVCALLEEGDPLEPVGNTVACRREQADVAAELEPDEHCKAAGPGGAGKCGTDCEAYCQLYAQACPKEDKYQSDEVCLKMCAGLTDQDRYDLVEDYGGDTLECRLVHVSSATVSPENHCSHAPIVRSDPCIDEADAEPTCEKYCDIQMVACDGELTQYESRKQCLDVCEALDRGTNSHTTENTVGCRHHHSFTSTIYPEDHCSHTGPTGDGHCGDTTTGNCDSYCQLVAAACPDQFDATLRDTETCLETCADLDESARDSFYSVDAGERSTGLNCRVLHAARAFADESACLAAVGGDPCQ